MSITIIIPTYNVEEYINEALISVIRQDIAFDEIIVIDDCSTDDTPAIISNYINIIDNIIYLNENIGLGSVRNIGLHLASSEYIYFMDSDDILEPNLCSSLKNIINNYNKPDVIGFGSTALVSNGKQVKFENRELALYIDKFDNIDLIRKVDVDASKSPCAFLYCSKKNIWSVNRITFPSIIYEDEYTYLLLLIYSNSIYLDNNTYYVRRVRDNSLSTEKFSYKHKISMERLILLLINEYYINKHNRYISDRLYNIQKKYIDRIIKNKYNIEKYAIKPVNITYCKIYIYYIYKIIKNIYD